MKKILFLLLISAASQAQTPIQSYVQQPIEIGPAQLGRDTLDNGYIVGRFAEFSALLINNRTKEITMQIRCYVRTPNLKPVGIKPVFVELRQGATTYNVTSNGNPIGGINEVLNVYGIRDTLTNGSDTTIGWKMQEGKYLTTVPVIDSWSMWTNMMDNLDARLRNVIRQTMLRPANVAIIINALKAAVSE